MEITSGIRQGCTGSPLLFIMVVNFIIDKIERSKIGFRSGSIRVPCLFFADDGLLLAQSVIELERLIVVLERGASEVGLRLNKSMSNVLIYGQNANYEYVHGIEVATSIRYLGELREIFFMYIKKIK